MISIMAKKKKSVTRNKHPQFPVRLPVELRRLLNALAERNARTPSEEARTAIREHLERAGVWPPKMSE